MVLQVIDGPSGLNEPEKWSYEFQDFIKQTLQENPRARPTADELLKVSTIKYILLEYFHQNLHFKTHVYSVASIY